MKGSSVLVLAVIITALTAWLAIVTAVQSNASLTQAFTAQYPSPEIATPPPSNTIVGETAVSLPLKVSVNSSDIKTTVVITE